MADPRDVDEIRQQLRELGYLSHGVDRWLARDAWRSRAFWSELIVVAAKGGLLVGLFMAIPLAAIVTIRNALPPLPLAILFATYFAGGFLFALLETALAGLLLRLRPAVPLERPLVLTMLSIVLALVPAAFVAAWWLGFEVPSSPLETAIGLALILLLLAASTMVFSAALVSYALFSTARVPTRSRRSPMLPLLVVGLLSIGGLLLAPQFRAAARPQPPPAAIAVEPADIRLALVAVDGLSYDIAASHARLRSLFDPIFPLPAADGRSPAELWATIGSGVGRELHGVRAIEGIRISGSGFLMQSVSSFDPILTCLAEPLGIADRQPLPPAVRLRDYVWEVFASRGLSAVSVNWWSTEERDTPSLLAVSQANIFSAVTPEGDRIALALAVDRAALAALERAVERREPRFATVFLPALDIVLNRSDAPPGRSVAASVAAVDRIAAAIESLQEEGFEVLLVGASGTGGAANVVASTIPLEPPRSLADVAPTVADLFGFPLSREMPGRTLVAGSSPDRIASYGSRIGEQAGIEVSEEYYEALRSLGYVQ